jgi:hypothetical protein
MEISNGVNFIHLLRPNQYIAAAENATTSPLAGIDHLYFIISANVGTIQKLETSYFKMSNEHST